MLDVERLFRQQTGLGKWTNVDSLMPRFKCKTEDNYSPMVVPEYDSLNSPIFACKFANQRGSEQLLAAVTEDGHLSLQDVNSNQTARTVQAHANAIFDLCWMFEQMQIVTVAGDHFAKLFAITESSIENVQLFCGHLRSVKTVASSCTDQSTFATGGRDSNIYIWDTRSDKYSHCIADRISTMTPIITSTPTKKKKKFAPISGANSITGLVFQNENTLISCAAGSGMIKVWDLRKHYSLSKKDPLPKHILTHPSNNTWRGYSNMLLDSDGIKLYANCLDGAIYCYNTSQYDSEPIMKYTGHLNNTHYVKSCLSGNGQYLISGSSDNNAYIWNVNNSNPLVKLFGHVAEVTAVAWCPTDLTICVTSSDDAALKVWRLDSESEVLPKDYNQCCYAEKISSAHAKRRLERYEAVRANKIPKLDCSIGDCPFVDKSLCENCNVIFNKRKVIDSLAPSCSKKPRLIGSYTDVNNEKVELCDLPNFAIDGNAPHLNYSPEKRPAADWLTNMRYEKTLFNKMNILEDGPSPLKVPKLNLIKHTPKRGTQSKALQTDLLKFFKVTNKQCGSKSPNCTLVEKCEN